MKRQSRSTTRALSCALTFTAMKGEEPPCKRRRVTNSLLMLPDDLILNCLARVSRLYYPTLSLVSKKLRSFIASIDLYQTRTLLGRSENCLYVCLKQSNSCGSYQLGWFILCHRPNSSKMILVPIPTPNLSLVLDAAVVVVPNIYTIPTPNLSLVLDAAVVVVPNIYTIPTPHISSSHCVIDNMYCFDGKIIWYDSKKEIWITLKGLEISLFEHYVGTMVDYGGKMLGFWTGDASFKNYNETTVWCAEIAIEKREIGEIWGMVQGFDVVYTTTNIPKMNVLSLVDALVTTI